MSVADTIKLTTLRVADRPTAAVVAGDRAAVIPGFSDVAQVLADGADGLACARAAAEAGPWFELDVGTVCVPVINPSAIFCVGLNYRAHIVEMGRELPAHPTLFAKLARSLVPPFAPVQLPRTSHTVDYEGELVVVVGKAGRGIPLHRAHEHIGGYTLMNDVSMRDWQYRTLQWCAGKNFERSTPVGPYVVPPDAVDLEAGELLVTVNGDVRQRARLTDLVFDPAALVCDISQFTTLKPGDLVATGTPGGVGHTMEPPGYLQDGDVVTVSVDGVGTLSTRFVG